MRAMVRGLSCLALTLGLAQTARGAPAPAYLFDVLHRPIYRTAWDRMLGRQGGLPPWLAAYARTTDGPATPGTVLTVGGTSREFFHVCEAHNCADSQFEVMFSNDAESAKGLLTVSGRPPRFFGAPDATERKALASANQD